MKLITSMNQSTLDCKLGTLLSALIITILVVQRHVPDYFISALEILPKHFMEQPHSTLT